VTRTGGDVTLSWDLPGDQDLAGVLVRRYDGGTAPVATDAGEVVHLGTDCSATFPAPRSGPVAVSLWSYDISGNVSEPRTVIVPAQQR
jgi:hypothetical protein